MVKTTAPKLDHRKEQPYVGIGVETPNENLPNVIPDLMGKVYGWLAEKNMAPAGAPFMRFNTIDMANKLDIEIGLPVAAAIAGDERVAAGVLPAGRYASLIYTDARLGYEGNKVLIEWAEAQGIQWDHWDTDKGDAFRSRYETFLTGPQDDPDIANWDTEVAIKLADN